MISRSQNIPRAMLEKYLKSTKVWRCKVWLQKVALATYRAVTELSCSLGEPQNNSPEKHASRGIIPEKFAYVC